MKSIIRLLALPVAIAVATTLNAATIKLSSVEAEKLSDIRLSHAGEEASLKAVLSELGKDLNRVAKRYLAEDQTLEIHFTNIDLAGEFEPWRSGNQQDVRIVKSIYIPRLEFTYTLTGADGTIVAEGSERLSDMSFQDRLSTSSERSKSTFYEREMLEDWMRTLRKQVKS
ncbi:MAG TPA: DUF3016 domain-containing protein [Opitutaceae bacterium]|nr:DUF3016 domain-containing protein [Opitutaceae bacterium]